MRIYLLVIAIALTQQGASIAQVHDHGSMETLGKVNFTTSCSAADEPEFNRAVALMHSFQFARAIESFHTILARDPACSMAWWGIALSNWGNPFAVGFKSAAQLEEGRKAVQQARDAGPKTERERSYVEAVAHLYSDPAKTDKLSRQVAYADAMDALCVAHPEDIEARIFYALALAAAADPTDKSYASQLKAGAILDSLFVQYPDHPGLAHYIIHTYDVPPLAGRALGAARRYNEIAPSTPHALHMPSHTFTRLGDWPASIEANRASAAAARSFGQPADELHARDYMLYAYLQTAQDNAARQVVESAAEVFSHYDPKQGINGAANPSAAYFAHAAISARYCLERHAWADSAMLEVYASPFPQTDALTWFARGMGAAHLKHAQDTRQAIGALAQLRDKLRDMKEAYWANQVEIQRQELAAWLVFAEGNSQAAVAAMRTAAEMEDKTEKSVVAPGPIAPAHELLGVILLESKRPVEALKEFEKTLTDEPNRFWSLYGAAESARLGGDPGKAQSYFKTLVTMARSADQPERNELAEARRYTESK